MPCRPSPAKSSAPTVPRRNLAELTGIFARRMSPSPFEWAVTRVALATLLVLLTDRSLPTYAASDEAGDLGGELKSCYWVAASYYGLQKCDAPPALTGAVYGRCAKEEQHIRNYIIADAKTKHPTLNSEEIAKTAIEKLRSKMDPQIQSWIVEAQIKGGNCRPPN
jgi:hypothetical protein